MGRQNCPYAQGMLHVSEMGIVVTLSLDSPIALKILWDNDLIFNGLWLGTHKSANRT